MCNAQELPFDLLPPILVQLSDRRDLHACALVSKAFNRVTTPLLYHTLDSRVISKHLIHHPSATLKEKPHLAQYVRHVTETGSVHRGLMPRYPNITQDTLAALSSCSNLHSMTWIDDTSTTGPILLVFLAVLRKLPLRSLTIRTHSDIGEKVWQELITFTGLEKVSIWCMEGPPRVLQGWSTALGKTLTHLELGRCAGVPPTILITVISHLPLLRDLRLKGAPASSIWHILSYLPQLRSLDTEYLGGGGTSGNFRRTQSLPVPGQSAHLQKQPPLPTLRNLIVRATTVDQKIWSWIRELVPNPGLESLKIHAFTLFDNSMMSYVESITGSGHATIPRMFILDMALVHRDTLKRFEVAGAGLMTLGDLDCLTGVFPKLEVLGCNVASRDANSIKQSIRSARNLMTLMAQIRWIPDHTGAVSQHQWTCFTIDDARDLMLRTEDSRLRTIGVGSLLYVGRWIHPGPIFEVVESVAGDKWST
ncbi:hypothetical protein E1B28_010255 [Marasmius oreades]|uniref:F-box domain-containing protein n=1 Tax=Marasmius oreades TaxID=181124 RepID=A0A9P7URA7_9AGAR|nr:uncharacterized protein E1B28_010255 [Marasmius oreades]KAG7091203.1 hypothetical protein E1B28_010255 [Marasmius oreades]